MSSHLPKIIRVSKPEDNNEANRYDILPPTKPISPNDVLIQPRTLGNDASSIINPLMAFEEAAPSEIIADSAEPLVHAIAISAAMKERLREVTQANGEIQPLTNPTEGLNCSDINPDTCQVPIEQREEPRESTFVGRLITEVKDDYRDARADADRNISLSISKVGLDLLIDYVSQAPMLLGTALRLTNSLLKKIRINPFKKLIKLTFSKKYTDLQR